MKRPSKTIILASASLLLLLFCCSCNKVSEMPPTNNSYDTGFVLPEAEVLTAADRAVIAAMEDEYDQNYNK